MQEYIQYLINDISGFPTPNDEQESKIPSQSELANCTIISHNCINHEITQQLNSVTSSPQVDFYSAAQEPMILNEGEHQQQQQQQQQQLDYSLKQLSASTAIVLHIRPSRPSKNNWQEFREILLHEELQKYPAHCYTGRLGFFKQDKFHIFNPYKYTFQLLANEELTSNGVTAVPLAKTSKNKNHVAIYFNMASNMCEMGYTFKLQIVNKETNKVDYTSPSFSLITKNQKVKKKKMLQQELERNKELGKK